MFKRCSGARGSVLVATVLLFHTITMSSVSSEVLFFDGFENLNLPAWDISDANPPGDVSVRDGMLILGNNAGLKIEVPGSYTWRDYTTTLRLRFRESEKRTMFTISVRCSLGAFGYWTQRQFSFFPLAGEITAYTINPKKQPLNADDLLEATKNHGTVQHNFDWNKWHLIEIETIGSLVSLSIDEQELLIFEDSARLAGTVAFRTNHEREGEFRVDIDFIRVDESPSDTLITTWATIKSSTTRGR